MDWMLDAGIEICNTLTRLEANGRDLSATECKNIIAKHYAAQQSVQADGLDVSQIDEAFVAGWEAYREAFDHYDDNGETAAHSLVWRKQEYLANVARR